MSMKLAMGFDTALNDADYRSQGWIGVPDISRGRIAARRSGTVMPGRSLKTLAGAGYLSSAATIGSGANDPAFYDTGLTVNSLWAAGGFALGTRMKFNETNMGSMLSDGILMAGSIDTSTSYAYAGGINQLANDGTNLYCIRSYSYNATNGVQNFVLSKSTDNGGSWTDLPLPGAPFVASVNTVVSCPAPGTVWVACASNATNTGSSRGHWFTTNDGATWTRCQDPAGALGYTQCIATGNATYPFAMLVSGAAAAGGIWVAQTLAGAWTRVNGNVPTTTAGTRLKLVNGNLVALNTSSVVISVPVSTLPTAGTVVTLGTPANGSSYLMDIVQVGTNYVLLGTSACYYVPVATAGAPAVATGWSTMVNSTASNNCYQAIVYDDGVMYAVGVQGRMCTSTDGVTLNDLGAASLPPYFNGLAGMAIMRCPNGQCLVVNVLNSNAYNSLGGALLLDNPANLASGWRCHNWYDQAEAATGAGSAFGVYAYTAGSLNSATGVLTVASNGASSTALFGLTASTPAGASAGSRYRTVSLYQSAATVAGTQQIPISYGADPIQLDPWHYYEIVAVADAANANRFFLSLKIDGNVVMSTAPTSVPLVATSDTTSALLINLPRSGQWTQFDDLYLTDYTTGQPNQGVIGPIQIMRRRATTDVQAQWTKTGTAASNSLSVNKDAISSTQTNYVGTTTANAQDIYGHSNPANTPDLSLYKVRAVKVESYLTRQGSSVPQAQLGIVSGGVAAQGATQTIGPNTPSRYQTIFEQDPNGNKAWTPTSATAVQSSITKIGS